MKRFTSIKPKWEKLLRWFLSVGGMKRGLLLGFCIPLVLSLAFGLVGAVLGNEMEDSAGSRLITFALLTFDLPGLLIFGQIRYAMGGGMLPGGNESMAMAFLVWSTLPACIFWALLGCTIGWCIRMANV
jgi:hypothetical protein